MGEDIKNEEEFVRGKVLERKVRGVCSRQREWPAGGCRGERQHPGTRRAVPLSWWEVRCAGERHSPRMGT